MKAGWKRMVAGAAGVLVLGGVFAGAIFARSTNRDSAAPADTGIARKVPVVLGRIAERSFEQRLTVQGNVEAKHFALVSARIPGTVESIFVDEGDRVIAEETALFQVDALKLRKAVDVSKQDLAIAQYGLKEKEAYREQKLADFEKAKIDYERYQLLYENNSISVDTLEQQRSRFLQTKAGVKHAQSVVDLAQEQVRQAELSLDIAEKDLDDTRVYSNLTGTVTQRFLEPGEMANAGTPVLRIEDTTVLEVSAFLPAQYYASIETGETPVRVQTCGIDVPPQPVVYKSPAINPQLRTFEVKCELQDPPAGVAAGAMADVTLLLRHTAGLGVPRDAVQLRADTHVLFTVQDDTARMLQVETGIESDGYIEVQGDSLTPDLPVVTMGQFLLNDGTPVAVREEEAA